MKLSRLVEIVINAALELDRIESIQRLRLKISANTNNNGGNALLDKLDKYKQSLIIELGLSPSEYNQLADIEVGEPSEFSEVISNLKLK